MLIILSPDWKVTTSLSQIKHEVLSKRKQTDAISRNSKSITYFKNSDYRAKLS